MLNHIPSIWEYRKRLGDNKEEAFLNVCTMWELLYQQISKNEDERKMVGHLHTLSTNFIDTTNVCKDIFKSYFDSDQSKPRMDGAFHCLRCVGSLQVSRYYHENFEFIIIIVDGC